ncbi:MAG: DUF1294 domain-containing protein [Erysipelotrichaceae bacterium]|nr:DUF1294 domain-containing protein [Erysipelotrichaceae bacterium]
MSVILLYYYLLVNVLAIIIVIYDKSNAIHQKSRVAERNLLRLAFLGGALGMYIMMLLLRHKTRQRLFMISLPLMLGLHLIIYYIVYYASI